MPVVSTPSFTWTNAISGNWSNAGDWTAVDGTAPPNDAAASAFFNDLGAAGPYTVTVDTGASFAIGTVSVSDPQVTLLLGGTLDFTSASAPRLSSTAGLIEVAAGGALSFADTAPGVIDLSFGGGTLQYDTTATLDNVTIDIDNGSAIVVNDTTGGVSAPTLTFGASTVTEHTAGIANLVVNEPTAASPAAGFVNQGSIVASAAGGTIDVANPSGVATSIFTNTGIITVTNGDSVVFDHGIDLKNDGTIDIQTGTVTAYGTLSNDNNTGTIYVWSGGTLDIESYVSNANDFGNVRFYGGSLILGGTLDNNFASFYVGAGTDLGTVALNGGTIAGGSIDDSGSGFVFNNGTFDGVYYYGTLDLSAAGANLTLLDNCSFYNDSITFTPGTILLTGDGATLTFNDTQTIDAATIDFGSTGAAAATLTADDANSLTTVLTFGSTLLLDHNAGLGNVVLHSPSGDASSGFDNQGTILAEAATGGEIKFTTDPAFTGAVFSNEGTITVTSGDSLLVSGLDFTNNIAGTIEVDNGTFTAAAGNAFTNAGSIAVGAQGVLDLEGSESNADLTGLTVVAGGLLQIGGTLYNYATIAAGGANPIAMIRLAGTIAGGTIVNGGGGFQFAGGILDGSGAGGTPLGVVFQGPLDLSAENARLTLTGGATIEGAGGVAPATINVTGRNSTLLMADSETLDNGTLSLGNAATPGSFLNLQDSPSGKTVLTLGAGFTLAHAAGIASINIDDSFATTGTGLDNQGTIAANQAGGVFTVLNVKGTAGVQFRNEGLLAVTDGDKAVFAKTDVFNSGTIEAFGGSSLTIERSFTNEAGGVVTIDPGSVMTVTGLDNLGSIDVADGSTLDLEGSWSNPGTINVENSTLKLGGSFTTAALSHIALSNSTLVLTGTFDNTGGTLVVGTGTALPHVDMQGGTIVGGVIDDHGAGLGYSGGGTFSGGVGYRGTVDLSAASASLTVAGGLGLAGPGGIGNGAVELTGSGASLAVSTSTTLDHATIDIGSTGTSTLAAVSSGIPTMLTFGPGLRIRQTGAKATLLVHDTTPSSANGLDNQGTIEAKFAGGVLAITDDIGAHGEVLTNEGTLAAGNTGTLLVSNLAVTNSGQISDTGGSSLDIASSLANTATGTVTVGGSVFSVTGLSNAGLLTVTSGGTAQLHGTWSNTGSISENGSTIDLGGHFTTASLAGLHRTGGKIKITGTLNNVGTILSVGTGTTLGKLVIVPGGSGNSVISGGTIDDHGGGLVLNGGTLNAVTYWGPIDLSAQNATIAVVGSLTALGAGGSGPGTINLTGGGAILSTLGTLSLHALTLNLGSATGSDILIANNGFTTGAVTLESTANLTMAGLSALIQGTNPDPSLSASFTNKGVITVGLANADLEVTLLNGGFTNKGTIDLTNGGTLQIDAGMSIVNNATIDISAAGTLLIQHGAGIYTSDQTAEAILLHDGGILDLHGAASSFVTFAPSTSTAGRLVVEQDGDYQNGGTLFGLNNGAAIQLAGRTISSAGFNAFHQLIASIAGGGTIAFNVGGDISGLVINPIGEGSDGLQDLITIACYARGTRIATPKGEVPVEDLAIGDDVLTHHGAARPIRWIGKRAYAGRFANRNPDVLPVLIRKGALGEGLPRRDLMISPNHAMYIDGVLIEARDLVDGDAIVHLDRVDSVEYFHIELDSHDVLLAEGAPSETFLETDGRAMFHNAHDYAHRYGLTSQGWVEYCAPRLRAGPTIEAVRRRVAANAAGQPRARAQG